LTSLTPGFPSARFFKIPAPLVAVQFNEDLLQIGSLAAQQSRKALAMDLAVRHGFAHFERVQRKLLDTMPRFGDAWR
jgi:hypothetical protein